MLLDINVFTSSVWTCLTLTVLVILIKGSLAGLACLLVRVPLRVSFVVGVRLAQVGEFSLILAAMALEQELFNSHQYQLLLIVSILSMLVTPLLIQASTGLSVKLFAKWKSKEVDSIEKEDPKLVGHVVIVGYGVLLL